MVAILNDLASSMNSAGSLGLNCALNEIKTSEACAKIHLLNIFHNTSQLHLAKLLPCETFPLYAMYSCHPIHFLSAVYVPPGQYAFKTNTTIVVPKGVTLAGTYR